MSQRRLGILQIPILLATRVVAAIETEAAAAGELAAGVQHAKTDRLSRPMVQAGTDAALGLALIFFGMGWLSGRVRLKSQQQHNAASGSWPADPICPGGSPITLGPG